MGQESAERLVERLSRQGEEALGKIAEELVANPVVSAAVARALDARESAVRAQEAAMGALGIPSVADVERVTRRLRSVSQRLEGIEDALDRLEQRSGGPGSGGAKVESQLQAIAADIAALRKSIAPGDEPQPRGQESLRVGDADA